MVYILRKNKISKFTLLKNHKDLKVTVLIISKMSSKVIKKINFKTEKRLNINADRDPHLIGNLILMYQIIKVISPKEIRDQHLIKLLSIMLLKE